MVLHGEWLGHSPGVVDLSLEKKEMEISFIWQNDKYEPLKLIRVDGFTLNQNSTVTIRLIVSNEGTGSVPRCAIYAGLSKNSNRWYKSIDFVVPIAPGEKRLIEATFINVGQDNEWPDAIALQVGSPSEYLLDPLSKIVKECALGPS